MSNPLFLLGAMLAGGAVAFAVYWLGIHIAFRRMNPVDQAALIRQIAMKTDRGSAKKRFTNFIRSFTGYKGAANVLTYGWILAFAITVTGALALGRDLISSIYMAVPASGVVVAMMARRGTRRQKIKFERQLMSAMPLIASQLEGGGGLKRSFERVVEVVEDPLKSEFVLLLNQVEAGASIVDAVKDLHERYPTPAMRLFEAAMEADANSPGGKLAPVLRAIAEGLERTFELRAEAEAEIAQSRYQFYGIVAGLAGIAFVMYNMGAEQTKAAFTSPLGMLIIIPVLANAVWGVLRVQKLFRQAEESN